EAYLSQLRGQSTKFNKTTPDEERKLGRDAGEVVYVHDERDPAALRTLMDWKSAQYRRTGRSDRFAHDWIIRLVEQLFHTRSQPFAGILSVLYADGKPIAAHFGLRSERVLACWFPAYDPAYSKYSPGLVLHLRMAEAAAADGIAYLDLGRGQKEYKDSLKTREIQVFEGWVTRRHPVAIGHRARRAPVRALRNVVVSRPELFEPADRLLKKMGKIRSGRK
ncbi:GNAT family N-acetyltransferase, partial [Streptomyces sp. KR55]|uniref:GNAT family N-acetyltransferase n=1 Tax=Streptomyces sp. KR55 TaxID=3457425 RepID=UPI003FD5727E